MMGMTDETLAQLKADLEVLQLDILPSVERLHSVVGDSFVLKMQLIVGRLAEHVGTLGAHFLIAQEKPEEAQDFLDATVNHPEIGKYSKNDTRAARGVK